MDSTEIYQEGYRIGPTHLYVEGEPASETIDFLTRNSRLGRSIWGDMHAQIAACRTGEQQLSALYSRFGPDVVREAARSIFDQCERLDREAVARVADGTYEAFGHLDSDRPGGSPVPVEVVGDGRRATSSPSTSPARAPDRRLPSTAAWPRRSRAPASLFKFLFNPDAPVTAGRSATSG